VGDRRLAAGSTRRGHGNARATREDTTTQQRTGPEWRRHAAPEAQPHTHHGTAAGAAPDDEAAERRRRAADDFRRRLAAGDYRGLFDPTVAGVMTQAIAETALGEEIGALRTAIARVMIQLPHEEDPTKLFATLARLTSASVQAHRTRHALKGDTAHDLIDSITRILMDVA